MSEAVFYMEPEFWVAVAFVAFVLLALRPVARIVAQALDARSAQIAAELAEARRLRQEAQAILADYQKKQSESLQEAKGILERTGRDAKTMAEHAEREMKSALDKRMKLAVEKIAQAETKALQDVQNHVIDIAIAAARSIIAEHLARGGSEELIRQAAHELERKLH